MKQQLVLLFSICLLFLALQVTSQSSPAPTPSGPRNISQILEKAGQFTTFTRLLKSTQEADQINTMLKSSSNQGLTMFAPTDNAFSNLPAGTLNSLSDQEKVQLVQFHILPGFISTSQFQTVSNPLRTQVGNSDNGQFPLNISTSGNQVNISTGVMTTTVSNTIFTDNQLAVYQVDKVLLPMALFGAPAAPAPAPSKSDKVVPKASDALAGSNNASVDTSGAFNCRIEVVLVSFIVGAVVSALAF